MRSSGAVPAYVAGQFREPVGFQQSASGQYFVFDRRAHTVYGLDSQQSSAWTIVTIGGESGKIIDPTAFAVEPNGTFVVADAPNNKERIQIFTRPGSGIGCRTLRVRSRRRQDPHGAASRRGDVVPSSFFFAKNNKILVTPGLFEFSAR